MIDKINAILPQTQCTRCGYPSCIEYAKAIASGVPINQCPPGGDAGIKKLATLLNTDILPLNTEHGYETRTVAFINEYECIGCTLCIKACPVDAIIGSNKLMHTVIQSECTGCDLCIPACPVDCISTALDTKWYQGRRDLAELRFSLHKQRQLSNTKDKHQILKEKLNDTITETNHHPSSK